MSSSSEHINRIAFVNPQGQIVSINPDSGQRRILTQIDCTFQFPAWAPNGNYLAAIGTDRIGAGTFIIPDQDTPAEPEQLFYSANHFPFYLYWAPDSRRLTFIASQAQDGIGLYLASITNRDYHLLTTGQPLFWAWSPDGNQLLIHCDANKPEARLAFFDLKHRDLGETLAQPGIFQAPGIAPTGQFYAFAELDVFDNGQLIVEDRRNQEQITVPYEGAIALSWSPVRDQLAFISPPSTVQRAYGPLQVLDTARKSVQVLVEATVFAFFWSPDGQKIAYLTLADASDERPSRSAAPTSRHNGTYRPDSSLAQAQQQQSQLETFRLELWVVDVAGKQQRQLTIFEPDTLFINQFLPFFDQYALSHRLWSPRSEALVLPIRANDSTQVTIIPVDGSTPISIAEGSMAFWSWQ